MSNTVPRAQRPDATLNFPLLFSPILFACGIRSLRTRYCTGWLPVREKSTFLCKAWLIHDFAASCEDSGNLPKRDQG